MRHAECTFVSVRAVVQRKLSFKRVLGSGKRFIVDYVTWTCPELKSDVAPLGKNYRQNKMATHNDTHIIQNISLLLIGRALLTNVVVILFWLVGKDSKCSRPDGMDGRVIISY